MTMIGIIAIFLILSVFVYHEVLQFSVNAHWEMEHS